MPPSFFSLTNDRNAKPMSSRTSLCPIVPGVFSISSPLYSSERLSSGRRSYSSKLTFLILIGAFICGLILRHLGINPVRPRQHAAHQVFRFGKSGLLQECDSTGAAASGAAVDDHLFAGIQLMHSFG